VLSFDKGGFSADSVLRRMNFEHARLRTSETTLKADSERASGR
jgi:hypothetical protein